MCQSQSSDIYFETDQVVKYQDIPNEAVPATVVHTSEACWEVIHRCEAISNAPRVDWSTFHSYTDMFEPWVGRIGTDSQSMFDRLFGKQDKSTTDSKEYKVSSLRSLDVLDPEWDLLNEIQITLRLLPDVTLEYVKGHQDDHTDYSRLSLMAQLNVDADSLATGYQQEVGRMFPQVLMSANAGAYLVVDEGTVTNKMVQTVRYLATGPSLWNYIMKKNNWDETVMRCINWKAHAKFMKSQIARRVHSSKMVHECLPTHSLRNRFDSGKTHVSCMSFMSICERNEGSYFAMLGILQSRLERLLLETP